VEPHWGEVEATGGRFPTIVALDLEATGLSSAADHVIEIGAVKFEGGEVLDRYHTLVNPGVRVPAMIRRLTGIDDSELARAPRLGEVIPSLREFIGDAGLLAHGAGYDVSFLREVLGEEAGRRQVFDSIELARVVFPAAPSYSLGGLCDQVGLQHPRPHHALEDAEATFRLFLALVRVAQQLAPAVLEQLRDLTAESAHSLRTVFHEMVGTPATPGSQTTTAVVPGPTPTAELADAARLPELSPDELATLLGPSGPLAAEPGWELREQQQEMCRAVAQAFARRRNLVVEAGTGTGKSLAYLLPALARAASAGDRVCVSTYTINLQEQLLHKDLPLAARILGIPLRAVLLKGRSHYLSRQRWEQLLAGTRGAEGAAVRLEGIDPAELLIFKLKLTVWLAWTRAGDRDELRLFGQEERIWRSVASEWGADCRDPACVDGPRPCFYHLSRRRAIDADVVVVNHALLLADAFQDNPLLPIARHLVLDEAHHLEEAATRGLTEEVREDDLMAMVAIASSAGRLGGRSGPSAALTRVGGELNAMFDALRLACRLVFGSDAGRELALDGQLDDNEGLLEARRRASAILALLPTLSAAESAVVEARLQRAAAMLGNDAEKIRWLAFGREGRVSIRRAPLEVAASLREHLFEDRDSVVLTSATLAVGGSFDYIRARCGVPASRLDELVLESPFDFLNQALLCLPADLPAPTEPGFEERLVDMIEGIAVALGGRTLVLFTATEQLAAVSAEVRARLVEHGIDVLAQGRGAGTRRTLVERFAARPQSVLCGTNSFWEGVDLPGSALSCVVIVRLPFRSPADPVMRARGQLLRDPFLELALPEAVLRLKQGFGRLIRKATDRGGVVILDSRVSSRAYGEHFLAALPRSTTFTGSSAAVPRAIREWIGDRAAISFENGKRISSRSQTQAGSGPVRAPAGRRRREPKPAPRAG
jgi:DNA polymerase III epsilon subunit family exonuclease